MLKKLGEFMKATKLKILAVAIPLSLWASHATAKSILLTGSLETVSPKVSFPTVGNQQAFVSPFQLLAKEVANSGCRITGDPNVAMADHGEELVCLYEWTKLPPGMSAAGLAADGYLLNVGQNEFKYSISYYSGSKLEKIKISEGSILVNTLEPDIPDFTGIKANLSHATVTGLDVTNYNKSSGLRSLVVSVVGQPYRQVVKVDGLGSCVVVVGKTECTIVTDVRSVGEEGKITGQTIHDITVDSENGYFSKQNKVFPEKFLLKWDYRTPEASALLMQARSPENGESQAHEVDGVSFVVENEQAKLVVNTPHFGLPGSWWVPTAKVELKPDPAFKPDIPVFEVDGVDMVDIGKMVSQPQKNFVLHPVGTPEVSNGKYIFTYDLSQVSDGRFIPSVSLNDAYDNRNDRTYDPVTLDRQPPIVKLFNKGQRFSDEGIVYFFEDMAVVALDTFDGGAEIISAKVNGSALTLEGSAKHVKKLNGIHLGLTPQMEYPLEITVRDTAGNRHTEAMRIRYMPMDYKLKYADLEFYKEAQRIDMDVVQTQGINCALYASEADLKNKPFGYGESQRCYLEWTSLPEGTSGSYIRGQHSLTGNLLKDSEESNNIVSYRIWMHDNKGNSALAAEEKDTLAVKVPPAPVLTVTQKGVIRPNFFPVELSGSRFATATAKGINADLELTADDGTEVTTLLSKQRNGYFAQSSTYQTLKVGPGKLWAKKKFDVEAKYSNASHVKSATTVETVYVPSRRIRSRIMTEDLRTLDTMNPTVSMKLGIYDGTDRDFVYDEDTMGEWTVYLAKERRDSETRTTYYDAITEKKKFVGGDTTFELDVSKVGYNSYRFVGVAELVSPIEGYERQVLSNASFFRVLKGGAIDGQLKTYRIASPIPFTASISYEPEERQDREALGDIAWEISKNGTTNWKSVAEYENKPRLRHLVDTAGRYFIRATVKNKFSGEVVTTDMLEILGYEVPDLKSSGPVALYEGEKGIIKLSDHGEPASESNGVIEWSMDGNVWEEGPNELEVTGTGDRMQIWSRMSYFNNELAGENRYDVHRHRISVKKPGPVSISLQAPRLAEVGKPVTIKPIVRLASGQLESEIVTEWMLPDGSVLDSNDLTYLPTPADAEKGHSELQFRSWVKQLKEETYAVKDLSIRTWEYKFPKFRFDVNYRTRYAPIQATAVARILEHQPAPVEFTFNFQMFEGMVKERESRERLTFSATKPGIHQISVVIKDDRGNEKTMYELLEVLPPPATQVELSANYSTQFMRQPLDASVRSRVVLGHPDDRVEKYEWYLDGKLLTDQTSSRASIDGMQEGEREIMLRVTSKFGIVQEETMTVQVAPNIPPKCELTHRQYGSTISVQSGCKDSDGRMSTHNWFIDGEMKKVFANNISVTGKTGEPIHIRVIGYDDSGDTAEASIEITPN